MTRRIPIVRNGLLHEYPEEAPSIDAIAVESVTWYAWLERHRSFRFEHLASTFTARKEQRSGGWYWYAYRRQAGRLRTAYLGRSAELSATRLHVISAELAGARIPGSPASHSPQRENVPTPGPEVPPHNLPRQLTSLVGREQEVAAAEALLQRPEVRLLNMVGTAGVGKTRLALQVATDLLESFVDGVFFVALAPVRDPELVLSTVAQALGLRAMEDQSSFDVLKTHLHNRHCFLVLDNFEQVVSAAPLISGLLETCPDLKLLVTSREVLHLRAEHQFSVPPLALPDRKRLPDEKALAHVAAVEMFVQRTQAIRSDFQLTTDNAATIAEICIRLDGLPLAIELAAARVKVLPPQALLARLDRRLQVLTVGARDLPERQRTLRNTIEWSYELLPVEEQRRFRRLSIFVGGCQLSAAEGLCCALGEEATTVLEGITSLIDKSLLHQVGKEDDEPRFAMLETIREYGVECLAASGEIETAQQEHASYYQALAQKAGLHLHSIEAGRWFDQLEQEHDNLRAALNWLLERGKAEQALRMGNDLSWFWLLRGYLSEGRKFLERGLSTQEKVALPIQARTLQLLAMLVINQGDAAHAEELLQESLVLCQETGDKRGSAWTLLSLSLPAEARSNYKRVGHFLEKSLALFRELGDEGSGGPSPAGGPYPAGGIMHALSHLASIALIQGEYAKAGSLAKESLSLLKAAGDADGIAEALNILATLAFNQGDYSGVQALLEESLVLNREDGIKMGIGSTLTLQAQFALLQGDTSRAHALVEESVEIWREIGDQNGLADSLSVLGRVATRQRDYARAQNLYEESLMTARKTENKLIITSVLEGLAEMVAAQGKSAWAARLWGAAESLREAMGAPLPPFWRTDYERVVASARSSLSAKTFTALWVEGRAMSLQHLLADREPTPALTALSSTAVTLAPASYAGLTAREMDVLRLLAQGLTSAQIAEQLVIGLVTVNSHVRSIYSKLGVTSRSAATRYAIEHKLV
jgi:predicted ATPase/DNA-binding CsgD family transcriptional regulator